MSVRNRFGTAAAIALMTTVGAVLLSACGPDTTDSGPTAAPTGAAPGSAAPGTAAPGAPSKPGSPAPAGKEVNGTSAANHLTISTGTQTVALNGTTVDFGTVVRDLAWSPDGKRAAFVNGNGDLVTANPDGTGKVTLAKNPGGETWSHPTWQHATADPGVTDVPGALDRFDTIVFASSKGGVSKLEKVPAKTSGATPEVLTPHSSEGGNENLPQPPQTGNTWANAGGHRGGIAYANTPADEVYIYDDYIRPSTRDMGKGSQPALSPDGEHLVFVRSVNGHDHLFARSTASDQKAEKDLTPSATTDYTEPAWSPDGKTIAARTPDGVSTLPADGSAAPTQVSTVKGLPAYRP
ncbi:WD40 repeat protein [Streptomyces sp. 1114.5]|uniref:PD40 domain-containing protein n=1 Tax=Streptomyces sp. 1114.5 TaxID=1938830 RepID=UPI000EAC4673|nr:PD40 domain-containing protein [Streptomyces sp. 1114.5]RKT08908.1 WD40 repeat protein [Streptomyces sp. 1114.5]